MRFRQARHSDNESDIEHLGERGVPTPINGRGAIGRVGLPGTLLCLALVAAAGLVPFLPTFHLFFSHTDDFLFFYPLPFSEYPRIFIPHWSFYRPLPEIFWLLEYRFLNVDPFGYRVVAWSLHLLCLLTVFWLGFVLSRSRFVATGAALIVSQQPALHDTVCRIGGGIDIMFTIPYLLCLIAYFRYRRARSTTALVASLVLATISLLSKEMAITLPLVLLLIELVFFSGRGRKETVRRCASAIRRTSPFFLLTATHVILFVLRPFWPKPSQIGLLSNFRSTALHVLSNTELVFSHLFAPLWLVVPTILLGIYIMLRARTTGGVGWEDSARLRRLMLFALGFTALSPIPVVPLPVMIEPHSFYLPVIASSLVTMASLATIRARLARSRKAAVALPAAILCAALLILNADLRGELAEFVKTNEVKGSIPMSVARNIDPKTANGQISLVFMPGDKVRSVGTDVIYFWVAGTRFMLHDSIEVMWVHEYLTRALVMGRPAPEPQFWECKDSEARASPELTEHIRRLLKYRASLGTALGTPPPLDRSKAGLSLTGPVPENTLDWDFSEGLDGWIVRRGSAKLANGYLDISSDDGLFVLESPRISIDPWYFATVNVVAKCDHKPDDSVWRIHYRSNGDDGWPKFKNRIAPINRDGNFNANLALMLVQFYWGYGRNIAGLRLVIEGLSPGTALQRISLSPALAPLSISGFRTISPGFSMKGPPRLDNFVDWSRPCDVKSAKSKASVGK
ncbi:MAG TPA: hypothetical protein VM163_13365 [bacterium]|nr:hypothetical protein [bacterium]